MSEGEVEALKARLASLGVQLGASMPSSPAPASSVVGHRTRKSPRPSANGTKPSHPLDPEMSPTMRRTTDSSSPASKGWQSGRASPARFRKLRPDYDSDGSVDVAELLERCSKVESMLSSAESAARYADKPANRNKVAQALRMARDVEGVTLRDSPPKLPKGKSKSRRSPNSSVISGGRQASASARHPTRQRVAGGAPSSRSPLASVLEQYREAETLWAQDKAKLRREVVEQRKRANKFESEYNKLAGQYESRAIDVKSMRAALKDRDGKLHQATIKQAEAEEALRRCNETAAEELAALSEERDDLKSLLQATLQRLETVDEVLHHADISTAMMEQKIKALDLERLKAINKAAVARAEANSLAKRQSKLQYHSMVLEQISEVQMKSARSRTEAIKNMEELARAKEKRGFDSDDSTDDDA